MLIKSLYTRLFRREDRFILYNSQSRFLAEISGDLYKVLYDRDYQQLPSELIEELKSKKILVEENEKYLHYNEAKLRFLATANDPTKMGLVIAPTLDCNFNCPYCFEGEKGGGIKMSDDVQKSLTDFIKRQELLKTIDITWYGGEPLLAFDRIKSIYDEVQTLEDVTLTSHAMISNGYLINSDVVDFVRETKMRRIQITLDGMRANHDKTRCLKFSGKPTFNKIVDNIGLLLDGAPECNVAVRVNISNENKADFISVFRLLRQTYPDKKFFIYPGIVREETPDKCSMCYNSINHQDYFELLKSCKDEGINVNFLPHLAWHTGCMMQNRNSYIVGPEGELYKCWNDVNHPEKIVGHINEKELSNLPLLMHYMVEATPFAVKECKECGVFPSCCGGCGSWISRNLLNGAAYSVCPFYKNPHLLEESLMLYLDNQDNDNTDMSV